MRLLVCVHVCASFLYGCLCGFLVHLYNLMWKSVSSLSCCSLQVVHLAFRDSRRLSENLLIWLGRTAEPQRLSYFYFIRIPV